MNTITARDSRETSALAIGKRITVALGIVIATVSSLIGALGGLDWITANLPLLGTGLGSLVSGGIVAYVAVRRMRLDRLAKGAGLIALLLLPVILSGCVAIRASGTNDSASVWALGLGADSAANLANVAVTGPSTNDSTGVSFDAANSEQQSAQAIQSLITLGRILGASQLGVPALASAASQADSADSDTVTAPATDPAPNAQTVYNADGYGGVPGATGEGVYGRPSCSRCRAYRAAHPDVQLINIDDASALAGMWSALRMRGFSGGSAALPVAVTADAYTLNAR